ncbi:MAG: hypothetical protein CL389_00105 [Acidiferrobacteraceae bacterium]|jgi:cytochrome b subunit of formate dehydrogenase|nr:hypothetical protein [Acidiferrobacteraceae bacterium]|tara:strand:+ start:5006 stop:5815 length:810 start_codon:yes stop_codon:yes gene_type:complete
MIQRFSLFHRITHGLIIVSFLGLVLTGMPLLYSHTRWGEVVYTLMGGYEMARLIHRAGALVTFLYAGLHLGWLLWRATRVGVKSLLWGPDSMVPQPRDFRDFWQDCRWLFGLGPRPAFERWTYWEKFDFWAIFWGIIVIGGSGLVLWFPAFLLRYFPPWLFHVALIVHSEEALLAASFIFTIHFFHSHLRPGKFPVDPVMFTGRVTEDELAHERPLYYRRLQAQGDMEALRVAPAPPLLERLLPYIWVPPVAIGGLMLFLMIWGAVSVG